VAQLLLDTHALVWALAQPDRLGPEARRAIETTENELLVSSATAWELATKHRLGELPGVDALVSGYAQQLARLGAHELVITSAHSLLAGSFGATHRDPFDRMLAAQASLEGLTLVSNDAAMAQFAPFGVRLLW
jgi:PIN domain nuclease of toxin-antitoxin system